MKKTPIRFSRRELAESAAGVALLGAVGAALRASGTPSGKPGGTDGATTSNAAPILLPPGAARGPEGDAAPFTARCIRCGRCISACHARVIVPAALSDGLIRMRTPKLDFRKGWCDLCGDCARVCPTGAILPFEKAETKVGLAVVTESCIALRTGACRICHVECPEDAITLTPENAPMVNPDLCNGCGLCEMRCPANVFQSYRTGRERGIVVRPIGDNPKPTPSTDPLAAPSTTQEDV